MGEQHSLELPVLFLLFPSGIVFTIVLRAHIMWLRGKLRGPGEFLFVLLDNIIT